MSTDLDRLLSAATAYLDHREKYGHRPATDERNPTFDEFMLALINTCPDGWSSAGDMARLLRRIAADYAKVVAERDGWRAIADRLGEALAEVQGDPPPDDRRRDVNDDELLTSRRMVAEIDRLMRDNERLRAALVRLSEFAGIPVVVEDGEFVAHDPEAAS